MNELIECASCMESFKWDDDVIQVKDKYYHEKCVTLYPTGFLAFLDGDCLGETENDNGEMAYSIFDEGQYIDSEESEAE